jgi:hypothetical protein
VGAGAAEGEANEVPENSKEMEGDMSGSHASAYLALPKIHSPAFAPLAAAAGKSRRVRSAVPETTRREPPWEGKRSATVCFAVWAVRHVRLFLPPLVSVVISLGPPMLCKFQAPQVSTGSLN